jgi:hypothetical protein
MDAISGGGEHARRGIAVEWLWVVLLFAIIFGPVVVHLCGAVEEKGSARVPIA